jgi:thiamine biosynthesis protein ThiS
MKIPIKKVAIELNRKIINKRYICRIILKKNDHIEIVHFIGGG